MDLQTIQKLVVPVLKRHKVAKASLFGSAVRGEMTTQSDIDILVELPSDIHGFSYVDLRVELQQELEDILGRNVDLVEYKLIKHSLKGYILPEQVKIL